MRLRKGAQGEGGRLLQGRRAKACARDALFRDGDRAMNQAGAG